MIINKKTITLLIMGLALAPEFAFAQSTNLGTMFANFTTSAVAITELIQYSAYIIGLFLIIGAIGKFMKQAGDSRGDTGGLRAPIVMFACGVGIFALTSTVSITLATMDLGSGPGDILNASVGNGLDQTTSAAIKGIFAFVRMLGYIAFIRGWLFLVDYGNGKQDGTMSRGLVHLFGGVAAINLLQTVKILANTLAPGVPLTWLS